MPFPAQPRTPPEAVAPEAKAEVTPEEVSELEPVQEPEPDPEIVVDAAPEPEPEREAEPEPEPVADVNSVEPEPEALAATEAEAEAGEVPEGEPEVVPEPEAMPEPEVIETGEVAGGADNPSNVVPLRKKNGEPEDGDDEPSRKGGSDIDGHYLRVAEALLFAAKEPLDIENVQARLPEEVSAEEVLDTLQLHYRDRGVVLVKTGDRWSFRTAPDLSGVLEIETQVTRKLSRAAVETLAIIAYHQPVTRGEMEEVRGVAMSRGTLDVLLEAGWIRPGKRRRTPGRPVTWVTTPKFLDHFGLGGLDELPGIDDLKAAGLLDTRPALGVYRERMEGEEDEADIEQEDMFDETDLPSNLIEAEET